MAVSRRIYMQRYRRRERNNWTRRDIRLVCGLRLQPGNSGAMWREAGKYFPYLTCKEVEQMGLYNSPTKH